MRHAVGLVPDMPRDETLARCWKALSTPNGEADAQCERCDRRLCVLIRSMVRRGHPLPRILTTHSRALSEADYCPWCARPTSEAARHRAPMEPFIAFARAVHGR